MTDRDFELLLEEEITALPPGDELVADITPWRQAVHRILWGMALCGITFRFLLLDYILPTVGMVMILLGFRTLRRENGWFMAGYIAAVVRTASSLFTLILNATLWAGEFYDSAAGDWLTILGVCITIFHPLCIWGGFRAIRQRVGVEETSNGFWLVIYYILLTVLALAEFEGLIVVAALLVVYILLLRSLWKYAALLDEAGYAVQASPVRLSDRSLTLLLTAVIAIGIGCGYLFCNQYPMDWSKQEAVCAKAQEIKADLLALGFPEYVLNDLTEEEILACRDAAIVHTRSDDHPVNDGRQVYGPDDYGGISHHRVYDVKELRITHIAVEIPGETRQFVLIQHFLWLEDPGFRGTDGIQIWPTSRNNDCWYPTTDYSGRVLYDQDGISYTSPYYSLGSVTGTSTSVFWENGISTDGIATFSLPRDGERCRGYISYIVEEFNPGHILDSWFNYYYQESAFQYPVRTAADVISPGTAGNRDIFNCIATALQMSYDAEKAINEGIYDFHFVG